MITLDDIQKLKNTITEESTNNFWVKLYDFDFTKCCTYQSDTAFFDITNNSQDKDKYGENINHNDFTIYLPKLNPELPKECLVITNGVNGRIKFFNDLCYDTNSDGYIKTSWTANKFDLNVATDNNRKYQSSSFFGLVSSDKKTCVAIGLYSELFSSKPQKSQYEWCIPGISYYMHLNDMSQKYLGHNIREWEILEKDGINFGGSYEYKGDGLGKYITDIMNHETMKNEL
jgi:hypothetical protein